MKTINATLKAEVDQCLNIEPMTVSKIHASPSICSNIRAYLIGKLEINGKVYSTKYLIDSQELFISRLR